MHTGNRSVKGPKGFHIEYRYDGDGTLDEILLYHFQECLVHLEDLGQKDWYCGVYLPGEKANQHGVIPPSHSVQLWFKNLIAANDDGDIPTGD
jgi:hypothetical protein